MHMHLASLNSRALDPSQEVLIGKHLTGSVISGQQENTG